MERGSGEHICKHCKKPSNIVQDKGIWMLFTVCAIFSVVILLFYFGFANIFQQAYNEDGSFSFVVAMFFGKYKTLKWILWELLPYLAFFFISPIFINYQMQKKYAYNSADRIDLGTDFIPPVDADSAPTSGSTRVIPKVGTTKVEDDFDFEEISSSSKKISDTRNFNLKETITEIDPESFVKTASSRSNAPLKKVERVKPQVVEEPQELYRVKVLREQERQKRELEEQAKSIDKSSGEKNFSANRKF